MGTNHGQRGQTIALVPAGLLLAALVLAGLTRLGVHLVERSQVQTAADAVALAGAAGGRAEATAVAAANRAELISFERRGQAVQVVVERDGRTATATAERYRPQDPPEEEPDVTQRPRGVLATVSLDPAHLH